MNELSEEKTLSLYPIDYPFETLVSRINANPPKLRLDPDFQRKYKWDKDGWGRSSKFIESCLMRIPLPSCYFAEDSDGKHLVIDGVQRLTTIDKFFKNEFPLEGMTIFKELEGMYFSDIGELQSELEATTIRCIVLRKENPKSLVREIFSRLNQGAVELSDQEIRHALYPGTLDDLLAELGKTPLVARFGLAEDSKVQRDGLEPEEQVLRYFAFSDDGTLRNFDSTLKEFLDDYMAKNAAMDEVNVEEYRNRFNSALKNCMAVFGKDVFTNSATDRKRKGLVHYDLLMPTLGELDEATVSSKLTEIRLAYKKLCESEEFQRTLSTGLQSKSSVMRRKNKWDIILKEALHGA